MVVRILFWVGGSFLITGSVLEYVKFRQPYQNLMTFALGVSCFLFNLKMGPVARKAFGAVLLALGILALARLALRGG